MVFLKLIDAHHLTAPYIFEKSIQWLTDILSAKYWVIYSPRLPCVSVNVCTYLNAFSIVTPNMITKLNHFDIFETFFGNFGSIFCSPCMVSVKKNHHGFHLPWIVIGLVWRDQWRIDICRKIKVALSSDDRDVIWWVAVNHTALDDGQMEEELMRGEL